MVARVANGWFRKAEDPAGDGASKTCRQRLDERDADARGVADGDAEDLARMTEGVAAGGRQGGGGPYHGRSTVAHVVGARPNFMKAAPVIAALRTRGVDQILIHTGQHYSDLLSDVFFRELDLPAPDVNLGIGSGTHAEQTARVMLALEPVLAEMAPALLVVYGDVNSTLATSIVASKIGLPVAHVEAGLRSFDESMPEEVNRRVTDSLSTLLFVTSPEGEDNLLREGIPGSAIRFVGNPMIDTLFGNLRRLDAPGIRARLGLLGPHVVVTVHRPANVDDPSAARRIVEMLGALPPDLTVVMPLHPRGRTSLAEAGLGGLERVRVIEPLGYLDFVSLVQGARVVITDSGGVQEETTMLGVPCLTIRPNTERPITISHGTNRLVTFEAVPGAVRAVLQRQNGYRPAVTPPRWDGAAGIRIADEISRWLERRAATTSQGRVRSPYASGRRSR